MGNIRQFDIRTNEAAYNLDAHVVVMGKDILVAVTGGDQPHIGAVTVAESHPSLKDPSLPDTTPSTLSLTGHKEAAITRPIANKLAAALNTNVVVVAGTHWNDIDRAGIDRVIHNAGILAALILEQLS